jgi:Tol biopolymer transport system component
MIQRDDVDRLLVDWIAQQDRSGASYLGEVLAVTQRTRQRPAWSFPERWIPVQLTLQRVAVPRAIAYLALLAILIAVAVAAVALVGMQRRLPAPFGPAANGLLGYAAANDIVLLDPKTGDSTTLVGGTEIDRLPAFSLDGTRVAFVRTTNGVDTVLVADVPGGRRRIPVTTEPLTDVAQLAWSPDGGQLAIVAGDESSRRIWMASADGSTAARMLDTNVAADNVAWRPPLGREIVFRGTATPGTGYRLYLANADGTNARPLPPIAGSDSADYDPTFSPDGQRIFYVRWGSDRGHVYTFDMARELENEIGPKDGRSVAAFEVSPDGASLSVAMPSQIDHGPLQIAVVAADGTGPVVDTGPLFNNTDTFHRWSPDGALILAWRARENLVVYLDPAGGPSRTLPWLDVVDPDWQRVAP